MRVLIVSPEESGRQKLTEALDRLGCQSVDVDSFQEACVQLKTRRFELILCAWSLPDSTADMLCFWQRTSLDEPLYFITFAPARMIDTDRALASGIDDFLEVPFSFDSLKAAIIKAGQRARTGIFAPPPGVGEGPRRRFNAPATAQDSLSTSQMFFDDIFSAINEAQTDLELQKKKAPTRILIAEDDPLMRELLAQFIQHLGYEPLAVNSASEALDALVQESFRIVISDWQMPPGQSGLELCIQVRELWGDASYFILLTGLHEADNFNRAFEAGADNYLTKPVDFDQLALTLQTAWRESAQRQGKAPPSGAR